MKRLQQFDLDKWFDERSSYYLNHHNVMIESDAFDRITMSSPFPGDTPTDPRITCCLFIRLENLYLARKWFKDNGNLDFEKLSRVYLYELYHQGLAQVICYLSGSNTDALTFKKNGHQFFVTDEARKQRNILELNLTTANDFASYALTYYAGNVQKQQDGKFSLFKALSKKRQLNFRSGISFILLADNRIMLTCPFPGFKMQMQEIQCSIDIYFETEQDLNEMFPFASMADLRKITTGQLLALFDAGKAGVFCLLELGELGCNLSFKKKAGKLIAIHEYYGTEYHVQDSLMTANDFIAHTLTYCLSRNQE